MNTALAEEIKKQIDAEGPNLYGLSVDGTGEDTVICFWRADNEVNLYSGAKTFTGAAVGIAMEEGLLKLTDTAISFFPEYRRVCCVQTEAITLRDLLQMRDGKRQFWFDASENERNLLDWAELYFRQPQQEPPAQAYYYSNACSYMLSRIVEKAAGCCLRDYLLPRLFKPLGIPNPQWHTCPQGHTLGATGLYLKHRDYAKIGKLYLQDGQYNGQQIIDSTFLHLSVADTVPTAARQDRIAENNCGYGYHLRKCSYPNAYRADGKYGQFCIVFAEQKLVVTTTAHEETKQDAIFQAIYRSVDAVMRAARAS